VVHFSGHGTDSGSLVLQGDDGEPQDVSAEAVAQLLSHFRSTIKLVVLNACFSSTEAKVMSRDLDFAVGMNAAIGDEAARCFSAAFYETLASRKTVKMAFDLGCNAVALRGLNEHTKPQLYVRKGLSPDTILSAVDVVAENPPTIRTKYKTPKHSPYSSLTRHSISVGLVIALSTLVWVGAYRRFPEVPLGSAETTVVVAIMSAIVYGIPALTQAIRKRWRMKTSSHPELPPRPRRGQA
jgi:hypothetical protein